MHLVVASVLRNDFWEELLSLHVEYLTRHVKHFFCCVFLLCHRDIFTEPLPANCPIILAPLFRLSGVMGLTQKGSSSHKPFIFQNKASELKILYPLCVPYGSRSKQRLFPKTAGRV
jgi:hypothetical protein